MKTKIKKYIKKLYHTVTSKEMSILPANIAFYFVLALIPIITITIVIASHFSITIDLVIDLINNIIPSPISDTIVEIISGKGFDSNVGIFNLIAFFVATNGTHAIVNVSNTLYKVEENDFIRDRIKATILLLIIVILLVFMLFVPLFGDKILSFIKEIDILSNIIDEIIFVFNLIKWPLTFLIIYFNLKLIYTIAPSTNIKSQDTTYGAFFTAILWMLVSAIFSYYLKYFGNYDILYGNLSSLIILMIWIYAISYIFVLGMAINVTKFDNKKEIKEHNK